MVHFVHELCGIWLHTCQREPGIYCNFPVSSQAGGGKMNKQKEMLNQLRH